MLEEARIVYEERVDDVDRYCAFLERLIDGKPTLLFHYPDGTTTEEAVDLAVTHTLKANAFLLIYNLVEATVRQALLAIRHNIDNNGHQFDDLHADLRRHITGLMRDDETRGAIMNSSYPIGRALLTAGFDAGKLLSGNIHHKTLKELANKIGFSVETDASKTRGGQRLTDVKKRRNDLAHGNLAFIECGRNTAIEDIIAIKDEVEAYLAEILNNIETYLGEKGYLS